MIGLYLSTVHANEDCLSYLRIMAGVLSRVNGHLDALMLELRIGVTG